MLKLSVLSFSFRCIYLLFLINIIVVIPLAGQEDEDGKACFLCNTEILHYHKESPYHDFSLKNELPYIGSFAGLAAINFLIDSPSPLTEEDILGLNAQRINSFDRYAISNSSEQAQDLSDFFLTGVLVLPSIFLSNHHTRKDIVPLVIMSLEVIGINIALTNITKKIAKRARPLAYNPDFPLEEKMTENARLSFFSGHTSHTSALSFLIAKVITDYHPEAKRGVKFGIWAFAASVPAVTGYLRVRAGKHFPTDVIAGYLAGGLLGVAIPALHKPHHHKTNRKFRVQPFLGMANASVRITF